VSLSQKFTSQFMREINLAVFIQETSANVILMVYKCFRGNGKFAFLSYYDVT